MLSQLLRVLFFEQNLWSQQCIATHVALGGMRNVLEISDVGKPLGSSFFTISLANMVNFKFCRAAFKQTCEENHYYWLIFRPIETKSETSIKFITYRISCFPSPNALFLVCAPEETAEFLEDIAWDLQLRFAARIPSTGRRDVGTANFGEVTKG